jgi:Family of unknown function (DUF6230)
MSSDPTPPLTSHRRARSGATAAPGRVRWRRFAVMFVPAAGVTALLLGLTANGALASSFSISGQQFEVSAASLDGTGFQQFGTVDFTASKQPVVVAESEIQSATITNLCQSLNTTVPILNIPLTLKITAGGGSTPVTADSLIIDANQLSGSVATFNNINIGQDASQLDAITPGSVPLGQAGTFGQQASHVNIQNLQQVAYSTSAGTFTLPGFSLSLTSGTSAASACF